MGYGYRLGSNPQTGNTFDPNLEVSEQKCISMLREQEEELNKKARGTDDEVRFAMKQKSTGWSMRDV